MLFEQMSLCGSLESDTLRLHFRWVLNCRPKRITELTEYACCGCPGYELTALHRSSDGYPPLSAIWGQSKPQSGISLTLSREEIATAGKISLQPSSRELSDQRDCRFVETGCVAYHRLGLLRVSWALRPQLTTFYDAIILNRPRGNCLSFLHYTNGYRMFV